MFHMELHCQHPDKVVDQAVGAVADFAAGSVDLQLGRLPQLMDQASR
jgi:hypothetical protein